MAITRKTDKDAKIISQCARGRYLRNVNCVTFSAASARGNNTAPQKIMADVIPNETCTKGIFIAPCAGKVLGVYANGSPYIDMASGGAAYVQVYKATSGADIALLTDNTNLGIKVGDVTVPTADTALDGTLSSTAGVVDLTAGQNVYATLNVRSAAVESVVGYLTLAVEWMPADKSYSQA